MLKYVLKRVGYMLATLFIITTITFFLIHTIPGDPLAQMARRLPEQVRLNYYKKYGLDKTVGEQYKIFMENLITKGSLGESLIYSGRGVKETIREHAPISARLGVQSIAMGFTIGILLGIIAAFNRNKWPDYLVIFIALLGVSVPSFVVAALLQYTFTVKHMVLPTTGWGSFKYTILPSIALSFGSIATYARYMRTNVLDVLGQDYIITAEAKGVSKGALVWKHVIRNAILPAITILGPQMAGIFVGSFVIESIFGIPGFGFYFVSSVQNRDYTMVMGQTIFLATLLVVAYLIVDILYGVIDPRIRITGEKK